MAGAGTNIPLSTRLVLRCRDCQSTPPGTHRHSAREGLAISVALIASAGLCLVAQAYFDAVGRQRTIWLFCGGVLAVCGCLLGVVEADRMTGRRVISDLLGDFNLAAIASRSRPVLSRRSEEDKCP